MSRMSDTLADNEILAPAVEVLQRALGPMLVAVVLYGSRARGDAHPDSDWDLLVIARGLPERPVERLVYLKRLLPVSCRGAISLLAKTPAEFEATLPSLFLDITLDGQILHDPNSYAAAHMARIRRLIDQTGLSRQRTPAGDMWLPARAVTAS